MVADAKVLPAGAFLATRLAALNPRDDTDILLFSDSEKGLEEACKIGVPAILRHTSFCDLQFDWMASSIWPAASYSRIFLPSKLRGEYQRIVYLDVDTYPVSAGLFDAFNLDLGGKPVAAVRGIFIAFSPHWDGLRQAAQLPFAGRWLLDGFMVIDSEVYDVSDVAGRSLATMRALRVPPVNADEGILNSVLGEDWVELSPRFHVPFQLLGTEISEAFVPELVHFPGPTKHWSTPSPAEGHPARKELAAYLANTPWHDYFERWRRPARRSPRTLRTLLTRLGFIAAHNGPATGLPRLANFDLVLPDLISYLRNTNFIDVAQGLTRPDLERLPS